MNFSLSRRSSRPPPSRSAGIALVSVLWLLLLLSGLAATVAYIARVEAMLARRAFDLARAQAAADAAIVNTIGRLSAENAGSHPPLGAVQKWEFDGIPTAITVSKEAGRIDVNRANDELLLALLRARGASEDTADTLVKALRNWQSAGTRELADASTGGGPNSLLTIQELQDVPGWRNQHVNCLTDSLTVYSGQIDVDAQDATPGALAALRWMQAHRPDGSNALMSDVAGTAGTRSVLGEVIRIKASATVSEVSTRSEWVGRLTGDIARPTLTMLWEHSPPTEPVSCSDSEEW